MNSINDIAEYLRNRGENLKGLDVNQIKFIEKKHGIILPKTYKQFLSLMGQGAGSYMMGSSVYYNELFDLKKWVTELVLENKVEQFSYDAFTFWMHQGYQAAFFKLTEGDDPPVYFYSEGHGGNQFKIKEKSLTNFFISQLISSYNDIDHSIYDNNM